MNNFEPKSIKVLGADTYEVVLQIKGELCTHQFTFEANPICARVLLREDHYYSKVWDIPETEWLENAIYAFDAARTLVIEAGSSEPIYLIWQGGNTYQLERADGSTETITVVENNTSRIAKWIHGSCEANLDPYGRWKTSSDVHPILESVLMLHQAIHPKYKIATTDH